MDDLSRIVLEPEESLEVELKTWLDLSDNSHRAKLAKELIALANHGGGVVVIGIDDETLQPVDRPADYSIDADDVNGIVDRYSDPAFHCTVKEIEGHYVIQVPGGHRIPIRSKRDGPDGEIQGNCYYIRRAGSRSEVPQNGLEWDQLMRRCIDNREEELEAMVARVLKALNTDTQEADQDDAKRIEDLL